MIGLFCFLLAVLASLRPAAGKGALLHLYAISKVWHLPKGAY
jgi:hypothetical protein